MAEDRKLFRDAMTRIGLATPKSMLANASELKKQDRSHHTAELARIDGLKVAGERATAGGFFEAVARRRVQPAEALSGTGAAEGPGWAACRRAAGHHPAVVHARRHRRRHRLQPRGISRDRRARAAGFADDRGAGRGERARLEGIRDGGGPRQGGQLHHHLLDRERRPDGRAHRRQHHGGAGPDADRQRIPDHAQRLDRGAARDRRGNGRIERAVRRQSRRRPPGRHRDEPARVALVRPGIEGDGLSHRQGRRQARRRLHAGRAGERHHGWRHAGIVRAHHRLRRHQDPPLRLREVPGRGAHADDLDEIGGRGDGDRAYVRREPAESAAWSRNRAQRARRLCLRRPRRR